MEKNDFTMVVDSSYPIIIIVSIEEQEKAVKEDKINKNDDVFLRKL